MRIKKNLGNDVVYFNKSTYFSNFIKKGIY